MGKLVTVQNLTTSKSGWEITILCLFSCIFQTEILEWSVGTGTYIAVLMMPIYKYPIYGRNNRDKYYKKIANTNSLLPDRSHFDIFIKE